MSKPKKMSYQNWFVVFYGEWHDFGFRRRPLSLESFFKIAEAGHNDPYQSKHNELRQQPTSLSGDRKIHFRCGNHESSETAGHHH